MLLLCRHHNPALVLCVIEWTAPSMYGKQSFLYSYNAFAISVIYTYIYFLFMQTNKTWASMSADEFIGSGCSFPIYILLFLFSICEMCFLFFISRHRSISSFEIWRHKITFNINWGRVCGCGQCVETVGYIYTRTYVARHIYNVVKPVDNTHFANT